MHKHQFVKYSGMSCDWGLAEAGWIRRSSRWHLHGHHCGCADELEESHVLSPVLKLSQRSYEIYAVCDPPYAQFDKPQGRTYFAGDCLSHLVGWQEGAVLSAHHAIERISSQIQS